MTVRPSLRYYERSIVTHDSAIRRRLGDTDSTTEGGCRRGRRAVRVQRTTLTPPLTPTFDRFEPGTTLTRLTDSEHPPRTLRPDRAVVSFPDAFAGDEYDRLTALLGFSEPVQRQALPFARAGRRPWLMQYAARCCAVCPSQGCSRGRVEAGEWIVCSSTRSTMLARPGFTVATCSRVDVVTSSRFTRC